MQSVRFTVLGTPKGKGRPRFAVMKKGVRAFTPTETANYENLVKLSYQQECGDIKLEGELEADIKAYFIPPASTSKKKKEQMLKGEIAYTHKPDLDNIVKILLDSLNGIAYDDDRQIVSLKIEKGYAEKAGVVVELRERR